MSASVVNERYELINKAVEEIKQKKLSLRAAAKKYSLPKSTLSDHVSGKHKGPHGKQPLFSKEEESVFAAHAAKVAEWGFPFTRQDLRFVVKMYLDKEGRNISVFNNNLPGEEWVNGFLSRHHDLRLRMSRNITYKRAMVNYNDVSKYFENLKTTLENTPPENILNYDETNLNDDPGSKKCIFKRGTKYPERIINSSKSCISMMFAGTASGQLLPPYVCYKAERLYDAWVSGGPAGTRYNRSKSGWIDEDTFTDWFRTIVLPWAKAIEGVKVVIGDNLSTHFSAEVVKLCADNNIKFVCLPPNATHLLQPLDVAFFRPLKGAWRQILLDWKMGADRRLTNLPKHMFPPLLKKLLEAIAPNQEKNLKSGFHACGISPLNANQVLQKLAKKPEEALESPTKKPRQLVGEAVIDFLANLRHSPGENKPKRKKRVNVPPGLSISVEDIEHEKVDDPQPMTSATARKLAAGKKGKRAREQSTSSEEPEGSVHLQDSSDEFHLSEPEGPPEHDQELVFKDPSIGDWLLVKFPGRKGLKYYVGQVVEVVPDGLTMNFARKMDKLFVFKWPEPEDRCVIDYDQIERNLSLPSFNYRNDRLVSFKFNYSFDGYTVY